MLKEEEVRNFIRETAALLDRAVDYSIREVPLDEVSIQRLKESNYVFSGIRPFMSSMRRFLPCWMKKGIKSRLNGF